jgi:hypothetical protein
MGIYVTSYPASPGQPPRTIRCRHLVSPIANGAAGLIDGGDFALYLSADELATLHRQLGDVIETHRRFMEAQTAALLAETGNADAAAQAVAA